YLERLQSGHREIPIVLLPLLNELRAARGEDGLSESVLFTPDLDRPLPATVPPALVAVDLAPPASPPSRVAALADAFARWNAAASAPPVEFATALDALLPHARMEPTRRMLWVASRALQAMGDGALAPSPALHDIFSGVVREARRSFGGGFDADNAEPALEPTRQLLYHVAQQHDAHPALHELRETFALSQAEISGAEIEHARGSLSGRNRALLDTVSAAVKEDLLRVKDALD